MSFTPSSILIFASFSFAVCVELFPSDDEFCLGSIANWTCTVNENAIGWIYDVHTRFYSTNDTNVLPLGSSPFRTGPTIISGGVSTSMATVNLSSNALNGTRLECSDGTNSSSALLNLKDSSAATSVNCRFDPVGAQVIVTWSGAICVPYYRVIVNNVLEDTVSGTSFSYTPPSPGIYSFQINSINYFGREIGCIASTPYPWLAPTTMINVEFVDSIGIIVSFKDNNNIGQPPVTECKIILDNNSTDCQISGTYTFPIKDGVNYTYNVTVRNVVGVIFEAGNILDLIITRPTEETEKPAIGDPVIFAIPFIVLGILIVLFVCWIVLRICWKRQCCCPRIWRSSFWLIFFCCDCCTYDLEEKEKGTIGLKNPNVGGEKGTDTSL